MDQIIAEVKKIPPVTRFLTLSSISVTLVSILTIVSPYTLLFERNLVFKQFQVSSMSEGKLGR
jgi:Derlin-2/3